MKTLSLTVPDKVYNFFADMRDKLNLSMSDTLKNYFGIDGEDIIFKLPIDDSDKRWMMLIIISFELMKVADIILTEKKEKSAKKGYTDMLNIVKKHRIGLDNLVDAIADKDVDINQDKLNQMFDFAIEVSLAIDKAVGNDRKMKKLQDFMLNFCKS